MKRTRRPGPGARRCAAALARGAKRAGVLGALALLGAAGCAESESAPAQGTTDPGGGTDEEPASVVAFVDEDAAGEGLAAFRHRTGAVGERWMPESMGGGGGFLDYDGDGHLDVVLVGGKEWGNDASPALRLFAGEGDGTFEEVTNRQGLGETSAYGFGVTTGDYDNDGDPDIYLTTLRGNKLFRNDAGTFREVSEAAGVVGDGRWSTEAVFFDADRDGHLDLYVGGYVRWSPEKDLQCTVDGQSDAYCTPEDYQGVSARFYHNDGDGTFTDWTRRAGFATAPGKTLGAATLDYNRDGWDDLVVANDAERNLLYRNRGDGTFVEEGVTSGIAFDARGKARSGMGVAVGDVDGSGEPTLFVGNFSTEFIGAYRHVAGGFFTDESVPSGIGRPSLLTLTFGLLLFDADLDADLDLLAANGHINEQVEAVGDSVRYRQAPQLFLGEGDGRFAVYEPPAGSTLRRALLGRGAAHGDYDGDGDRDVLIVENGGAAHLLRNDARTGSSGQGYRYLRVTLEGRASNRDGIGARVRAVAGDLRQERCVRGGGSYLSQSERTLTFGLRDAAQVDTLRVEWPSGRTDQFTNVAAGQSVHVVEGAATLDAPGGSTAREEPSEGV